MNSFEINSVEELPIVAKSLVDSLNGRTVLAFHGNMGAGKTTFIKALCAELGVTDTVASPTFAIVNEYLTPNQKTIFHFDLYRLETMDDLMNIGAEDYFYSGNLCLIEWPDIASSLLPANTVKINLTVGQEGTRIIQWE
ncbi:MAG: tRNA (adenosine(37)-N6)-threonylcarbamoyltransferase complex ATPase subunit type 1 TsaE [Bacteroidales bacterium]|nr:tRNA (adenosine(37)-N6)-threonylcarbamoyltransferase complex ATPase subunit type 1 TsaE [Bacteroidales bacterium]